MRPAVLILTVLVLPSFFKVMVAGLAEGLIIIVGSGGKKVIFKEKGSEERVEILIFDSKKISSIFSGPKSYSPSPSQSAKRI